MCSSACGSGVQDMRESSPQNASKYQGFRCKLRWCNAICRRFGLKFLLSTCGEGAREAVMRRASAQGKLLTVDTSIPQHCSLSYDTGGLQCGEGKGALKITWMPQGRASFGLSRLAHVRRCKACFQAAPPAVATLPRGKLHRVMGHPCRWTRTHECEPGGRVCTLAGAPRGARLPSFRANSRLRQDSVDSHHIQLSTVGATQEDGGEKNKWQRWQAHEPRMLLAAISPPTLRGAGKQRAVA